MSGGDWRDARDRRDEVKAAFLEGYKFGAYGEGLDQSWSGSEALKKLGSCLPGILPYEPPYTAQGCEIRDAAGCSLGDFRTRQIATEIARLLNEASAPRRR